jgi:hypothetical protein
VPREGPGGPLLTEIADSCRLGDMAKSAFKNESFDVLCLKLAFRRSSTSSIVWTAKPIEVVEMHKKEIEMSYGGHVT